MSLPIVVAIFGKAASGKDTFANDLANFLEVPTNLVVSTTTRPKRQGEVEGRDYNFVSKREFKNRQFSNQFVESNCFRGWYYGIEHTAISKDEINIAVVDPNGIVSLSYYYDVIPVYLAAPIVTRLRRYAARDGKWSLEMVRRLAADALDFMDAKSVIARFPECVQVDTSKITTPAMFEIQHIVEDRQNNSK